MPSVYNTAFGGNPIAPALPTYLALNFGVNTILGWPLESNITSPAVAEWIDCTATAAALTLQLSDARQVSTGYTAIFNNVGANTFSVLDAQGNTLMAPASGAAWILVLSDNSTLQGTWRTLQLGAGVSSANAAALAGAGLKAITTTLNERIVINAQAVNYTIGSGTNQDRATCVEWTGGSGGTFSSLTAAALGSDWFCYIKNSGSGVVTFTPGSGQINGSASQTFNPNDSAIIVTDGTNFFTIGLGQAVASSFNFVTISLTGASGTVVLTGAQLNRVSYKFTGALAGNTTVQVPASIQQYWVDNETTGAFTLTISAGGLGTTFTVPQANRTILYCDGLNIVNAISSGAIQFADGTAAAPSITFASDTTLGFYKVGTDVLGISTAGVQRVSINAVGLVAVNSNLSVNSSGAATGNPVLVFANASNNVAASFQDSGSVVNCVIAVSGSVNVGAYFGTANANALFFITNNNNRIQISSSGNVTVLAPVGGTALTSNASGGTLPALDLANNTNSLNNPVLRLLNTNVSAQIGVDFFASSTSALTGRIRNDFNDNMTYVTFLNTGAHFFFTGGDAGTGFNLFQIGNSSGTFPFLQGRGPVAAGLVDMTPDTGTFTITGTGFVANPTGTATWVRNGKQITINIPSLSGTSNATTFTLTGIPAAIQPATLTQVTVVLAGADNTVGLYNVQVQITAASGTWTVMKASVAGAWTNAGVKNLGNGFSLSFSYLLT